MVKNPKILSRILCVAFCCVILASSLIPSASAVSMNFGFDDISTKVGAFAGAKVLLKTNAFSNSGIECGNLSFTCELADVVAYSSSWNDVALGDSYSPTDAIVYHSEARTYPYVAYTSSSGQTLELFRIEECIKVFQMNGEDFNKVNTAYFAFEPIAGSYDPNVINGMFWIHSVDKQALNFYCSARFWFIVDGELKSDYLYTSGTTTGQQSPLFHRVVSEIAAEHGVKMGDPFMITDLCIEVYDSAYEGITELSFSRLGNVFGNISPGDAEWPLSNDWPPASGDVSSFMEKANGFKYNGTGGTGGTGGGSSSGGSFSPGATGDSTSQLVGVGSAMSSFLSSVIGEFATTPLFGDFSVGDMLFITVACAVVFAVIKVFL